MKITLQKVFINTKILKNLQKFCSDGCRNLGGSFLKQVGVGGGGAGSYNRLDAARSTQSKYFSLILYLLGGFLWKAPEPSKFCFLLLKLKKELYNGIFARRLL